MGAVNEKLLCMETFLSSWYTHREMKRKPNTRNGMQKTVQKKLPYVVKRSNAGLGLFATKEFKRGDFIIEYTGEKISEEVANRRGGKYLFTITDTDGQVLGAQRIMKKTE